MKLKLSKEEVEGLQQHNDHQVLGKFCDDWLAMRAMLEEVKRKGICPWCYVSWSYPCRDDCKLKELLG